jgi:hypothetical protein
MCFESFLDFRTYRFLSRMGRIDSPKENRNYEKPFHKFEASRAVVSAVFSGKSSAR